MADKSKPAASPRLHAQRFSFAPSLQLSSCRDELVRALLDAYRASARDVLTELWEADVERLCGERWKPRSSSKVSRAGWCACQLTLGGSLIEVRRPRVRSVAGREIELPTVKSATSRDLLDRAAFEDVTAAITTGGFPPLRHKRDRIAEVFVSRLAGRMSTINAGVRGDLDPGLLIADIEFPDQSFLGAVGISYDGDRQLIGLRAGSCASLANVGGLLDDLIARHRRASPPDVFVVGESATVHDSIRERFGKSAMLQRCAFEKRRSVLAMLPPAEQLSVLERLLDAYGETNVTAAEAALREIGASLRSEHREAADLLADGLAETLTLHRMRGGSTRRRSRRTASPKHSKP